MKKRSSTIVMTGGGSGGHLTPLVSVAQSIKNLSNDFKLVYIGQKGDLLGDVVNEKALFDAAYSVRAGKFRRYHRQGFKQLLDLETMLKNIRDVVYVVIGLVQSVILMLRLKPSALFAKGGFVSVPVGLAAALFRVPIISHDSDVLPGLANRILAPFVSVHAVGQPAKYYKYPPDKTFNVGVPISGQYFKVTPSDMANARKQLNIDQSSKVLFVIGGGLGALRVNQAVIDIAKSLFDTLDNLYILHVAGRAQQATVQKSYDQVLNSAQQSRVVVYGFTDQVALLGQAADLVITRAGATNMAELSAQAKACIIIPNHQLTGGHQTKNAEVYTANNSAVVLPESDIDQLEKTIVDLINDDDKRHSLSEKIYTKINHDSSDKLATLILDLAKRQ